MAKNSITINGKKVNINTEKPIVADLVGQLLKAVTERHFDIGMPIFEHANGDSYLLCRVKTGSRYVAKLMNLRTGAARNSTKVVYVQDPDGGKNGRGYVIDLPCKKDRFYDPENRGKFIDTDENGHVI
jgi:hypothetical protein